MEPNESNMHAQAAGAAAADSTGETLKACGGPASCAPGNSGGGSSCCGGGEVTLEPKSPGAIAGEGSPEGCVEGCVEGRLDEMTELPGEGSRLAPPGGDDDD